MREVVSHYLEALQHKTADERPWTRALEQASRWLWDAVIAPSLEHLDPAVPITVVAGGLLALLPLHAAWTVDEAPPGGRRYADDLLCLRFAPSARAIAPGSGPVDGRGEPRPPETVQLLSGPGLDHDLLEVAAVRAAVQVVGGATPLARVEDALGALRSHGVVHLNCHGSGRPDQPLESALHLADQDLTVRRLLGERLHADLVVLSACETAVLGTRLPDEAVSLPSGLLAAGVRSCIASLWPVPTRATAALMGLFYRTWSAQDGAPADALRRSQQLLRKSSNAELAELVPEVVQPPEGCGPLTLQLWSRGRPFQAMDSWAGFLYVGV